MATSSSGSAAAESRNRQTLIRLLIAMLLASLGLTSCGEESPTTLIKPDDFKAAKGEASDAWVGIVGMPPCRALREFNRDLNLAASGDVTGTTVGFEGGGYVFAVVFSPTATSPSADEVVAGVQGHVKDCAAEIADDPSRNVEELSDLPMEATGFRGVENNFTSEYVYAATSGDRLLVAGMEYATEDRAPVSVERLLELSADRAPDVAETEGW
ncbi:hypothetical protein [Nocardioides albus]|uniref:Uncharacterized protein n=1 Tax=Nocardioides albus TaxID=1841 RepID=A0A7W5A7R4_9ACTN|nr:hypothetical protein [Nocardioides albus]MBB3090980.1 hypothetical protein [Nocardioides albus]GGU38763.1 hypothetical protein GCM10007979_42510 [Nocardioides albus]